MQLRPTPEQERWLVLGARVPEHADPSFVSSRSGGWQRSSLLVRSASFLLGLIAAIVIAVIFGLLGQSEKSLLVTGPVLILIAEWRIVRQRLFGGGFEEALEVTGLLLLAVESHGGVEFYTKPGGQLLVAAALLIAGLRLLNPLFTTAAAIVASCALATQLQGPAVGSYTATAASVADARAFAATWASVFCYALALLALALGAFRFRRPAHDRMLDWLVLALPLAGYLWSGGRHYLIELTEYHPSNAAHPILISLAALAYAVVALSVGISRRTHAPVIAFMVGVACAAFELHALSRWPTEVRLIVAGSALLIVALALNRYLRTPRRGITSERVSQRQGPESLLQLAGVANLTPHSTPEIPEGPRANDGFQPGGGQFGGGGASGSY